MKQKKWGDIAIEILMWVFSILIIYPLLMVIITSFKTKAEANVLNISLPKEWMFVNYLQVIEEGRIIRSFWNSTLITTFSVLLIIVLTSMLSFILMRRRGNLEMNIYRFMMFGIIAPFAALPTVQLLKMMHLHGTKFALILVYGALFMPFSTMLYSSFIVGIPRELDEAAVIDGCSGFKLFSTIIFPLLLPVTATVGILNFMWVWNDFQYPMYLLNSSKNWTLPMSVFSFFGQYNRSWHLVSADMVLVSLPVILLYLFAQRFIISGMTAGAVKG